jgi:N-acetylglucosamine-6-phosphate deacetylase
MLIAAGCVLTPDVMHAPGYVETAGAAIVAVGEGPPPGTPDADYPDAVLAP